MTTSPLIAVRARWCAETLIGGTMGNGISNIRVGQNCLPSRSILMSKCFSTKSSRAEEITRQTLRAMYRYDYNSRRRLDQAANRPGVSSSFHIFKRTENGSSSCIKYQNSALPFGNLKRLEIHDIVRLIRFVRQDEALMNNRILWSAILERLSVLTADVGNKYLPRVIHCLAAHHGKSHSYSAFPLLRHLARQVMQYSDLFDFSDIAMILNAYAGMRLQHVHIITQLSGVIPEVLYKSSGSPVNRDNKYKQQSHNPTVWRYMNDNMSGQLLWKDLGYVAKTFKEHSIGNERFDQLCAGLLQYHLSFYIQAYYNKNLPLMEQGGSLVPNYCPQSPSIFEETDYSTQFTRFRKDKTQRSATTSTKGPMWKQVLAHFSVLFGTSGSLIPISTTHLLRILSYLTIDGCSAYQNLLKDAQTFVLIQVRMGNSDAGKSIFNKDSQSAEKHSPLDFRFALEDLPLTCTMPLATNANRKLIRSEGPRSTVRTKQQLMVGSTASDNSALRKSTNINISFRKLCEMIILLLRGGGVVETNLYKCWTQQMRRHMSKLDSEEINFVAEIVHRKSFYSRFNTNRFLKQSCNVLTLSCRSNLTNPTLYASCLTLLRMPYYQGKIENLLHDCILQLVSSIEEIEKSQSDPISQQGKRLNISILPCLPYLVRIFPNQPTPEFRMLLRFACQHQISNDSSTEDLLALAEAIHVAENLTAKSGVIIAPPDKLDELMSGKQCASSAVVPEVWIQLLRRLQVLIARGPKYKHTSSDLPMKYEEALRLGILLMQQSLQHSTGVTQKTEVILCIRQWVLMNHSDREDRGTVKPEAALRNLEFALILNEQFYRRQLGHTRDVTEDPHCASAKCHKMGDSSGADKVYASSSHIENEELVVLACRKMLDRLVDCDKSVLLDLGKLLLDNHRRIVADLRSHWTTHGSSTSDSHPRVSRASNLHASVPNPTAVDPFNIHLLGTTSLDGQTGSCQPCDVPPCAIRPSAVHSPSLPYSHAQCHTSDPETTQAYLRKLEAMSVLVENWFAKFGVQIYNFSADELGLVLGSSAQLVHLLRDPTRYYESFKLRETPGDLCPTEKAETSGLKTTKRLLKKATDFIDHVCLHRLCSQSTWSQETNSSYPTPNPARRLRSSSDHWCKSRLPPMIANMSSEVALFVMYTLESDDVLVNIAPSIGKLTKSVVTRQLEELSWHKCQMPHVDIVEPKKQQFKTASRAMSLFRLHETSQSKVTAGCFIHPSQHLSKSHALLSTLSHEFVEPHRPPDSRRPTPPEKSHVDMGNMVKALHSLQLSEKRTSTEHFMIHALFTLAANSARTQRIFRSICPQF